MNFTTPVVPKLAITKLADGAVKYCRLRAPAAILTTFAGVLNWLAPTPTTPLMFTTSPTARPVTVIVVAVRAKRPLVSEPARVPVYARPISAKVIAWSFRSAFHSTDSSVCTREVAKYGRIYVENENSAGLSAVLKLREPLLALPPASLIDTASDAVL